MSEGIELKTVNPVVFDDPNKCTGFKWNMCDLRRLNFKMNDETELLYQSGWICWLFDYEFPPNSNEKCQECKDHWRENKIIQCKGHLAHCSEIDHCKTCEESRELLKTLSEG